MGGCLTGVAFSAGEPSLDAVMTVTASFRFYAQLNDFLTPPRRNRTFAADCARASTTKHMIEALGVPHTEVELILVNGEPAGFERLIRDGDRVVAYPPFLALDIRPLGRSRPQEFRFVADVHLGGLARLLRMAGFDTLYHHALTDAEIAELADRQGRVVLTRDRELLKRRAVRQGCYVRALKPPAQLREVCARLDLAGHLRPFSLCLACNRPLRPVERQTVEARLPPGVLRCCDAFWTCEACQRVYWKGSHWRNMRALLEPVLSAAAGRCRPDRPGPGA